MGRRGRDGRWVLYLGPLAAGRAPAKRRGADASASRRRYSQHRVRLPPLTKGLALRPTPVTQLPWVRWGGQWRVRRGSDGEDTSAVCRKQHRVPAVEPVLPSIQIQEVRRRSLGSGAAGVRACRLVALALPDPGRAIGSRPLIHPGSDRKQRGDHPIRFLDDPLRQRHFRRTD